MMSGMPAEVEAWINRLGGGRVVGSQPVGGGCIHNGRRLVSESGRTFFLKTNDHVPSDLFSTEAEGLRALARKSDLRIPQVLAVGGSYLLLEDLSPAIPQPDFWTQLGYGLARLHEVINPSFGFKHDNYLGSTPQPNPEIIDGYAFFAEHRLVYQSEMALNHGLLSRRDALRVEQLAARLRNWVPLQPASLIHGDLWSGNIISDSVGHPALIDPAVHYGWREADLAMMTLFGSPPESFFKAYDEITSLQEGLDDRFPLYNLYHLLNHLNIFGRSYLPQVVAILKRFIGD